MVDIKKNYETIRSEISSDVLLVAVTKTRSPEEINQVIEAGATDIGENKVQEIIDKYDAVAPVKWHMIGHLQRNKVKYIIDKVHMIHSVDSLRLAEEISKRAKANDLTMDVLIQVNAAGEESKFGIGLEEAKPLIDDILNNCPNIRIRGLMSIAPAAEDPNDIRIYFRQVADLYKEIKNDIAHERLEFDTLSMGMTHDYEVAIEEGSNLIRVGTAIFGERDYSKQNV